MGEYASAPTTERLEPRCEWIGAKHHLHARCVQLLIIVLHYGVEKTNRRIYEPNYDKHVDEEDGYLQTPSVDGTATLIPEESIILQSLNSWEEATPVRNGTVIHTFGEFDSEKELFKLEPDELAKISLYVWLEGQDVDCINAIGHHAELMANIQFTATTEGQSGMVPIN